MVDTIIVEDNHYFRQSFRKILSDHFPGMGIVEAVDGREALEICTLDPPNLVFLDINLPLVNGLEVCKAIRRDHPRAVIFMLTNYDLPEYRQAAYQNGADHFFAKDTRQEAILSQVDLEWRKINPSPRPPAVYTNQPLISAVAAPKISR